MLNEFICVNSKEAKMQDSSEIIDKILKNGKKEKYYCPICGEEMIFKNCTEKEKHFSHKSNTKCNYEKGGEAEIHKIAKRYLIENIGDTFVMYGNEIMGDGKTFVLAGSRKIAVKEIHMEKSLKKVLGLDRDYRPDVFLEATTGEIIALEIYNTHAKNQEDIDKLKEKNIVVYEININNLKSLNMIEIYQNMDLIYSLNKLYFEKTIGNIRNEYKKIRNKLKSCEQNKIMLNKENEILNKHNKELHEDNERLYKENRMMEYSTRIVPELHKRIKELNSIKREYDRGFPDVSSIDGYIKEITVLGGRMYLKVGNKATGDITITTTDKKNFAFLKDMEGAFGRIEWKKEGDTYKLKKFGFKSGMLSNKNHFLFQRFYIDYKDGKLYYGKDIRNKEKMLNGLSEYGGYIGSWDKFKEII